MSINVLRADGAWWLERSGRATRIATDAATTAELIADLKTVQSAAEAAPSEEAVSVASLDIDSPVTTPCRVVAQMVNYRSHAKESGFDPAKVSPTFFRKSSGSVVGPTATIVKPAHVRLLDYEVELGLVIGAPLPVGTVVTNDNIQDYVVGLVIANDVSARDVQLTKGQFYESKSYPTFTPVGPFLTLLEPGDLRRLSDLRLQLSVDGVLRQDRTAADMIHLPAASLTALSRFQALEPGDVVLTGTPGGTALQAPPHAVELVAHFLPAQVKWKVFFDKQASNPKYLRAGNRVTASIRTQDGLLDLGTQDCTVAEA
jgi:2-keto-4-pentenoate hydratase/2-oxohepta-3-ene-1,7-dioic acid hydratase in catechol pathway